MADVTPAAREAVEVVMPITTYVASPFQSAGLLPCVSQHRAASRAWRSCCFSHDAEHVVGATEEKGTYRLYFWSRYDGALVKSIYGPKKALVDVVWHPVRSFAAVCTRVVAR